jgi:hypothetical protein
MLKITATFIDEITGDIPTRIGSPMTGIKILPQ